MPTKSMLIMAAMERSNKIAEEDKAIKAGIFYRFFGGRNFKVLARTETGYRLKVGRYDHQTRDVLADEVSSIAMGHVGGVTIMSTRSA